MCGFSASNWQHRHADIILHNHRIAAAAIEKIKYFFDFDRYVPHPLIYHKGKGSIKIKQGHTATYVGLPNARDVLSGCIIGQCYISSEDTAFCS